MKYHIILLKEGDIMKICSMFEGIIVGMMILFGIIILMPRKYFSKIKKLRRKTFRKMDNMNLSIEDMM